MLSTLLLTLVVAAGPQVDVTSTGGTSATGTLESLDAENLVIGTTDGPLTLRTKEVLSITPTMKPSVPDEISSAWVELVDGSTLVATTYESASGQANVSLVGGGGLELPTGTIASVRFRQLSPTANDQWEEILAEVVASDLIVVQKGDSLDFVEGVMGDVTAEEVEFDLDGDVLNVKRRKLAGLVYFHPPGDATASVLCEVVDVGGSTFKALAVSVVEDQLLIATAGGVTLRRPNDQLARIDFSGGKTIYLSEMDWEPGKSEWKPFFALPKESDAARRFFSPRRDRGFDSTELHLGGNKYAKGLGLYSRTTLSYRLGGKYRRMVAIAGIDDDVGERGNVQLVIAGDGKTLFEASLSGGDDPLPLDLDVRGVKRLSILVDYGEDQDVSDHLYLCEARILK